jgi:hypothetical protein
VTDRQENQVIHEEHESDIEEAREDKKIYIRVNYYIPKETKVKIEDKFLFHLLNENMTTDKNDVNAQQFDIYTKCVSAIKTLPSSVKRNIILNDYQRTVEKYAKVMKRMFEEPEKEKAFLQNLLYNNEHVMNFERKRKITFNYYVFLKIKNTHAVDFIFWLNDNFKFRGTTFEELPIKYVISFSYLEMFGIWFDETLEDAIINTYFKFSKEIQTNEQKFQNKKTNESLSEKFSLNCLPKAVLNHALFTKAKELFFNDLELNIVTLEIEMKESSSDI